MLSVSLREQIKCRWREFLREPSAFFWVVFMPLLWMVILGFSFSNSSSESYGVGWADSYKNTDFQTALKEHDQIKLTSGNLEELRTAIKRGKIQLVITAGTTGDELSYLLDPTNPSAQRAKEKVDDILQRTAGRSDLFASKVEAIEAKGTRYIDFLIPGLLGLSIMTSSLFGVAMTIVSNRRENLLKRYIATPMKPYEYIVSHIFGRFFVLAAEFFSVMLAGYLLFDFVVEGSFLSYTVIAMMGAAAFTAIAMVCGSRTKSIPTVSGMTNLISMPMMMLSGIFFSTQNFPEWLQSVVKFFPLTAIVDALRKISLEGQSFDQLGFELSILMIYTIVGVVASKVLFRWY